MSANTHQSICMICGTVFNADVGHTCLNGNYVLSAVAGQVATFDAATDPFGNAAYWRTECQNLKARLEAAETRIGTLQALDIANREIERQLRARLAAAEADAEQANQALLLARDYYWAEREEFIKNHPDVMLLPGNSQMYWHVRNAVQDAIAAHEARKGEG
jgi:hypothetical protein